MSNSLDPDQARRFVGPDLGPNYLPRLSADDTQVDKELKWVSEQVGHKPGCTVICSQKPKLQNLT